jgi:hypothetical protein
LQPLPKLLQSYKFALRDHDLQPRDDFGLQNTLERSQELLGLGISINDSVINSVIDPEAARIPELL